MNVINTQLFSHVKL
jgi:hypothetical protein